MMIRWTGLAPWEFELPFPGSLTSTFLFGSGPDGLEGVFDGPQDGVLHERKVLLHHAIPSQREGLVFKAHRLVFHSTLGLRVIKKKKRSEAARGTCSR